MSMGSSSLLPAVEVPTATRTPYEAMAWFLLGYRRAITQYRYERCTKEVKAAFCFARQIACENGVFSPMDAWRMAEVAKRLAGSQSLFRAE